MKKTFAFVLFALLVMSCHKNSHTIIGEWKPVSVNVDFDEYKYTPDMIRQIGLSEKANVVIIAPDSTMQYISGGDTVVGRVSLRGGEMFIDKEKFATYRNDTITETKRTVLGDVVIKYTKP